MGRVMRPAPGKTMALWLDHSGNFLRFMTDTAEVFADGVSKLDDGEHDSKVRKEPSEDDKKQMACGGCGYILSPSSTHCPSCGMERAKTPNRVMIVSGELVEVSLGSKASQLPAWASDRDSVYRQLCGLALERKHGDVDAAERFAKAQYRSIYGSWPRLAMRSIEPEAPCHELANKVKSLLIAWAKRRKRPLDNTAAV